MSSLILDLQKDAYDNTINLSKLLRKAYIIARKLNIIEFEKWISCELNGYEDHDIKNIPEYRTVHGDVRGWNPYHGWTPVIIEHEKLSEKLSKNVISQSIPDLEILSNSDGDQLVIKYSQSMQNFLSEHTGFRTTYEMHLSKCQVMSILESVRNILLEWALKLEEDGIIGEGLGFTSEEKETAQKNQYNVYNFNGNISNSQIQQNTTNSSQYLENQSFDIEGVLKIVEIISTKINELNLESDNEKEILAEIQTIKAQTQSPKPKSFIIKESLRTIRNILEGVAGNFISSGIMFEIAKLIQ